MEDFLASLPEDKRKIAEELNNELLSTTTKQANESSPKSSEMFTEWKGYRFAMQGRADTAKFAYEQLEIGKNSVLLATFPKSGTNWFYEILRHVLYEDEKLHSLSKAIPLLFGLELCSPEKFLLLEHVPFPRQLFASHLPAELVNLDKIKKNKGKVIVVIRNPKDQAVSWFHFAQSELFDPLRDVLSNEWNEFFSSYVQGKHVMETRLGEWYPDYLLGWYKHKDDDNVLFMHFEDMKRDPHTQIRKMGEFLDVKLSTERVEEIVSATTFRAMKKQEHDGSNKLFKSLGVLRKGEVGSWKHTFTVSQSELMDRLVNEKLGNTDIKFTYE